MDVSGEIKLCDCVIIEIWMLFCFKCMFEWNYIEILF